MGAHIVRNVLYLVPILHLIFSILTFANNDIFFDLSKYKQFKKFEAFDQVIPRFFAYSLWQEATAPLTFLGCSILAIICIKWFLWSMVEKILRTCCPKIFTQF